MGESLIVRKASQRVESFPNGKTALPINDIGVWQRCAGQNAKYTVLADLIGDINHFKIIISSSNAMEYFLRSTLIQEGVQNNGAAAGAFDSVRRYLNPDMMGDMSPYGAVSHTISGGGGFTYRAFNANDSTGYITQSVGKFIQWVQTSNIYPMWVYKVSVRDTYGYGGQVKIQGLLENWSLIDLTSAITLPHNTLVTVPTFPHNKKCIGLRLVILRQSQGANDWMYLNSLKLYGV